MMWIYRERPHKKYQHFPLELRIAFFLGHPVYYIEGEKNFIWAWPFSIINKIYIFSTIKALVFYCSITNVKKLNIIMDLLYYNNIFYDDKGTLNLFLMQYW